MNRGHIYLDYCAGAPLLPSVRQALQAHLDAGHCGNPASVHAHGRQQEAILSKARESIAALMGTRASEIVLVSSGTEANNLALKGAAWRALAEKRPLGIAVGAAEHPSILEPCRWLAPRGIDIFSIGVQSNGTLDVERLQQALTGGVGLVTLSAVNHETGNRSNLKEVISLAKGAGALVHVDAAMAWGRIPMNVEELGVDLVTLSGHKLGGPQGSGALYVRRGLKLDALFHGGVQERKRRAGAVNVLAILGLGVACDTLQDWWSPEQLRQYTVGLWTAIEQAIPDVYLNGDLAGAPGILNLSLEGLEGETLLMNLDIEGISISSGAPCSSGSLEPSPVLLAMGYSEARARSAIRISMGPGTDGQTIDQLMEHLPKLVARLRSITC